MLTANLFGHKKGAFTGADRDNPGLIKLAEGGVLFLEVLHRIFRSLPRQIRINWGSAFTQ